MYSDYMVYREYKSTYVGSIYQLYGKHLISGHHIGSFRLEDGTYVDRTISTSMVLTTKPGQQHILKLREADYKRSISKDLLFSFGSIMLLSISFVMFLYTLFVTKLFNRIP